MGLLEYALIGGVLYGLFFGLVGIGLNLIFGVMRIINLAHGDLIMLGAFGAYWVYHLLGVSPLFGIPLEVIGFTIIGIPLYYLVVPRLLATRDPEMLSFILFFGLSQVIEASAVLGFGNNQRSIPQFTLRSGSVSIFGQSFPASWAIAAGVSVVAILALYGYLYHTRFGYATRAVMASRDEALTSGINVHRISAISFVGGFCLAGLAGVFAPYMLGAIDPNMGVNLTTLSFAIVVIGSLGQPLGTVIGGLVYGIAIMLMQTYLPSWSNLLPYLLLIAIVLIKPSGLLGRQVRHA